MHVETKELEYCKLEVAYKADEETVKNKYQEAVESLRKIQIPGFRAGRAPDYAIKARCKDKIKSWTGRELITTAYDDIIFQTKMKTIGQPSVTEFSLKDNDFSCTMILHKKPDFDLKDYKGYEIPKPHMDRDVDAHIEKTIQDIRMRFAEVRPYQEGDLVDMGDQITMDYYSTCEGEETQKAEGILYGVGDNKLTGLDDNILGMAPGETREFNGNVDGKEAKCKVTLHMGMKRIPCPMDDELAQKVGLQNFDEVRTKIAVIANEQIRNQENNLIKQQIIARLLEANPFEVPAWLTKMEVQHILMQNNLSDDTKLSDEERQVFTDKANKQIRLSLILDSIRDAEPEAVLSDAEAVNALKQQVAMQGQEPEKFLIESQRSGRLHGMLAQLRDEFALQWLVKNSKIVE